MSYSKDFDHEGERLRVTAKSKGDDQYQVVVGERTLDLRAVTLPDGRLRIEHEGQNIYAAAAGRSGSNGLHVRVNNQTYDLQLHTGGELSNSLPGDGTVLAPMTGTVLKIQIDVGDTVTAGQTVAILTAMKMEHKLLAGIDGTVTEVLESEGATVDQGAIILKIEP